MDPTIRAVLIAKGEALQVEPALLAAFCATETSWRPFATRFEPATADYATTVGLFAARVATSSETEQVHQQTSWGLMQVMGYVARGLGFLGHLPELTGAELGVEYGARTLKTLQKRFGEPGVLGFDERIACAYNHGHPERAADGTWVVQAYVDQVHANYQANAGNF